MYKFVFYVPLAQAELVKQAVFATRNRGRIKGGVGLYG